MEEAATVLAAKYTMGLIQDSDEKNNLILCNVNSLPTSQATVSTLM
jgi:hypothetical protein